GRRINMETFQVEHVIKWMERTNDKIGQNKEYLTSLDQAIGDGDHGINMVRGFQEVVNKITEQEYKTVADALKDIAMTLISKVGGASGPLYGTAFLKFSMASKDHDVTYDTFVKGVEDACNGINQRGKADVGEKTMLDVWCPVADQLKKENQFNADVILRTTKEAMENTKDIMATKGRASYMKERSIGHLDPGAVSSFYLFEALAEVIQEGA